jgi:hypothetical protein
VPLKLGDFEIAFKAALKKVKSLKLKILYLWKKCLLNGVQQQLI